MVGAFTELKNSLLGSWTHVHSGFIGDSVIGENCRLGAGFVTANRRMDRQKIKSTVKDKKVDTGLSFLGCLMGDECRAGIRSSTMPGVVIGNHCIVGPGETLFENLGSKQKFFGQSKNGGEKK
jgi:bifunctional N-acetylglucosamine-1-phosphate-uridyltransferase/glucosamine-1-phosphate-acetyltransferase GlmU-like protein